MILDTIAQSTKKRVALAKQQLPMDKLKTLALSLPARENRPFEGALRQQGISFICEIKKASPSKGIIAQDFPYLAIAKEYELCGASAISVLTEPAFFQGSDAYLTEIKQTVSTPVLRKDFTIDPYQLYQTKLLGADAVLLICALLNTQTMKEYLDICDQLGLSALVEAHSEQEIESALEAGAKIIGVNNRDLKTFEVDINTCIKLRTLVPNDILFVAESGIQTVQDIQILKDARVDAVLIGETLMRSDNKKEMIAQLKGLQ